MDAALIRRMAGERKLNKERVLEALDTLGGGTVPQVAARARLSWQCADSHLTELLWDGEVVREVVKTGAIGRAPAVYRRKG